MSESGYPPLRITPSPVLRVPKAERTKAVILNAAIEFLWMRPFRDLTVAELMHPTGLSRAAFYQYFREIHALMQALQGVIQGEIFTAAGPWIEGVGDPVALMKETIAGLVSVCYDRGPLIRALSDAATTDDVFEQAWSGFLEAFDDAATARIEEDQRQGLIPDFDARPVAFALNRLDASTLIAAFGQHPRKDPEPVRESLLRIWVSTLYGTERPGNDSGLVRK
jgi:AcrR family transcriptional regulator